MTATNEAPADSGYAAFISYSHADKPVARWLKRALGEVIPAPLRRKLAWDKKRRRIGDVFLDESSVAASPSVSGALREALDRADGLVLICSPASAASTYVDLEVQRFLDRGKRDRIFCLIASGRPLASLKGTPAEECFPPALVRLAAAEGKGSEPLAAAYGETAAERARARDQILCGLLEVSQDDLNGARNRAALVRNVAIGAAATATAAMAYAGAWAYLLPHVTYAKSYVRVWGGWREVDKIADTQARRRAESYEFHRKGALNQPTEIRIVDGHGNCTDDGVTDIVGQNFKQQCSYARACVVRLALGSDGAAKTETLVSQYGRTLETVEYSSAATAVFTEAGFLCDRSKAGVNYLTVERYADGAQKGRDKTIRLLGEGEKRGAREPRPNNDGAYGFRYEYDAPGRLTRATVLDASGAPALNAKGIAATEYAYSPAGDLFASAYKDAAGAPTIAESGAARTVWTVDGDGNRLSEQALDQNGQPAANVQGVARTVYTRGPNGEPITTAFFDPSDKPAGNEDFVQRIERAFNKSGYEVKTRYFADGQTRARDKKGCAGYAMDVNAKGEVIQRACLDVTDIITTDVTGVGFARDRASPTGDHIESTVFAADGAPTMIIPRDGLDSPATHKVQFTHDERGRLVARGYFDTLGRPLVVRGLGFAREVYTLDDAGNTTSISDFDDVGAPVIALDNGCHETVFAYDRRGNNVSYLCRNQSREPMPSSEGVVETRYEYDALDRVKAASNFDERGAPTADSRGVYNYRYEYDRFGRIIQTEYRDANGELSSANAFGCAITAASRATANQRATKTYLCFDERKRPKAITGAAFKIVEVSERKNVVESANLDLNDHLALGAGGYARQRSTFDERELETVAEFFGADGKPLRAAGHAAKVLSTYDSRRNLIERHWLDAEGKPLPSDCPYRQWEYDAVGNQTANICAGEGAHPANGVFVTRSQFNQLGKETRTAYFGKNGEPVPLGRDYVSLGEYDERGCKVRDTYIDNPKGNVAGALVVLRKNDAFCRERERSYQRDGKPALSETGRAFVEFAYDPAGRMTEERSLDTQRRPININGALYAVRRWTYASAFDKPEPICFSAAGARVSCAEQN